MREGSLSWLYTGWLIIISLAINDVQSEPAKGPNITNITPSSTRLQVTWEKLGVGNANGEITRYEVCYNYRLDSTDPDCTTSKNVAGVDNTTDLTGLRSARMYTVAVRAFTKFGAGPLGESKIAKTNESEPQREVVSIYGDNFAIPPSRSQYFIEVYRCVEVEIGECPGGPNGYPVQKKLVEIETVVTDPSNKKKFYKYVVYNHTSCTCGKLGNRKLYKTITNNKVSEVYFNAKYSNNPVNLLRLSDVCNSPQPRYNLTHWHQSVFPNFKYLAYQQCLPGCVVKIKKTVNVTITFMSGKRKIVSLTNDISCKAYDAGNAETQYISKTGNLSPKDPVGNLLVRAPAKSATVTMVNTVSSTVLEVTWEKLKESDTNGNITRYRVCYATQQLSLDHDSCTNYKDVLGADNTTFNLTGLNEATLYFVAVKAGTRAGFGRNGNNLNSTTLEAAPAKGPVITSITAPSSTSLKIAWNELSDDDANGVITGYRVCYKPVGSSVDICNSVGNVLRITLANFKKDTSYIIAVQAATMIGFGSPGANMTGRTNEDTPAKGPDISSITAPSSTSLSVAWEKLSHDDANGEITEYRVCYRPIKSSEKICNLEKAVGNVLSTTLTGLNKYALYVVAVRAATGLGRFGPLGAYKTEGTGEDTPGAPTIDTQSISPGLTTIQLIWSPPSQHNGVITTYEVRWRSRDNGSGSYKNTSLPTPRSPYVIHNLRPGTTYDLSVAAFTNIGKGLADSTQKNTIQSDLDGKQIGIVAVSDDATQIGFKLPTIKYSERMSITYFYVIVKRWATDEKTSELPATPQSELTNYDNSDNGMKPYITIRKNMYKNGMNIIVGDDSKTNATARRKRRNINEYQNAPLSENTQYAIFIRVFYNKEGTSFQSSDILVRTTAAEENNGSGLTIALAGGVTGSVIFLAVALGTFLHQLRRFRKKHREQSVKAFHLWHQRRANGRNRPISILYEEEPENTETEVMPETISYVAILKDWEISPYNLTLLDKRLGAGQFGIVKRGLYTPSENGDPEDVAVKMLKENATKSHLADLLDEIKVMEKISKEPHPNVIRFIGSCSFEGKLVLVTEFCPGGNLLKFLIHSRVSHNSTPNNVNIISTLSHRQLLEIAVHVASGMAHLSSLKFVHRDLAARNVLIGEGNEAKVSDFGLTRDIGNAEEYIRNKQNILPVKWMALESLIHGRFTTASDVWSFGVLLHEITTLGDEPYKGISPYHIINHVGSGCRMSKPSHCSSEVYKIMTNCWKVNPKDRPTFPEVLQDLRQMLADNEKSYIDVQQVQDEKLQTAIEPSDATVKDGDTTEDKTA